MAQAYAQRLRAWRQRVHESVAAAGPLSSFEGVFCAYRSAAEGPLVDDDWTMRLLQVAEVRQRAPFARLCACHARHATSGTERRPGRAACGRRACCSSTAALPRLAAAAACALRGRGSSGATLPLLGRLGGPRQICRAQAVVHRAVAAGLRGIEEPGSLFSRAVQWSASCMASVRVYVTERSGAEVPAPRGRALPHSERAPQTLSVGTIAGVERLRLALRSLLDARGPRDESGSLRAASIWNRLLSRLCALWPALQVRRCACSAVSLTACSVTRATRAASCTWSSKRPTRPHPWCWPARSCSKSECVQLPSRSPRSLTSDNSGCS
jgi:hypothetical protein